MFSKSSSTNATNAANTILAANITMEQLGERHMELARAANGRRRKTGKHEWTRGEHTDLSLTFLRDCEAKSLHQIAQDIHAHFAEYLTQQDQGDECDDDAPLVGPEAASEQSATEYREGLPSVTAIEMKLIHCMLLHRNCKNAKSKMGTSPSMMHVEVWQHLLKAQKHREMIRTMKPPAPAPAPAPAPEPSSRLGKVHRRKESECDREDFPPAKRRKLNPEDDDDSNSREKFMEMQELCKALDTIGSQVEAREQDHERANAAIAQSLVSIRENKQDIELLTGYIQDTQSGINKCVERISVEIARIERILAERQRVTPPAAAPAPAHDDQDDRDDPSDNEYDDYNIDGHQVSGWIYKEEYHEPARGGGYGYDHAEECS
jgi:hypothetical protein